MAWYRTGTISLTNGSTTVTGSGTTWIANAGIGEALYAPDGRLYEITNIASDTSITIAPAYLGTTASAQAYTFVPSQSYIRDLAAQAADLVNNYSTIYNTVGAGKFGDGTLAAPGIRFSDDLDTGFYRSATNEVTFVAGGVAQFKYDTTGISFVTSPAFTTPISVTANSTTNALRITQTGSGNALLVEDSANPDATPFVVANNGQVTSGHTSQPFFISGVVPNVASIGTSNTTGGFVAATYSNDTNPAWMFLGKSRGAIGAQGVVSSGDSIGNIDFAASDGTIFTTAARIQAAVDGTPGTNDMPGRLVFSTTADGGSVPTERMRIDNQGRVGIGAPAFPGIGSLYVARNITGDTFAYGVLNGSTVQSDVTNTAYFYRTTANTQATAFTLTNLEHYGAVQGTFGASSVVTNQYGFNASANLTGATNNYGFYSAIASGTGRWNFYANGTAANYFAGNVGIGALPVSGVKLTVAQTTDGEIARFQRNGGSNIPILRVNLTESTAIAEIEQTGAVAGSIAFKTGAAERGRIAANGTISLGAAPGSESLRVTPVASAVNYVNVFGNVAANAPFLLLSGSDTNIPLTLATKGTGNFGFYTGAGSGLSGSVQQFAIAHTASAVNYLQVTGAATGTSPIFSAQGSDTNIGFNFNAKNSGGFAFNATGTQFTIAPTTSAVNYLQVTGGATGGAPILSAQGSDANIKMQFLSKGTGDGTYHYDFLTSSFARVFAVSSVASSVNWIQVSPSATGNATSISAAGSDTNIDLALTPKGTGRVRFGTLTANADAPITGYITIKDSAGNLRKLAVIA